MERNGKLFKKRCVKPLFKNNRFYNVPVNLSCNKMGLSEIWADICQNASILNQDEKNSCFYKQFKTKPAKGVSEKCSLSEELEKDTDSDSVKQVKTIKIVTFCDLQNKKRCKYFIKGMACSSNCRYLHAYPKDDGVYCKYYYLHRECPFYPCIYYHGKVCSLNTKKLYEDRYKRKRCPKIMNRESCTDSSCHKRHKLPKEDNVYCFYQLSLECRFESECLYKHRNDLNSVPQSNMTCRNDSAQYDLKQKSQIEYEGVINSQSTEITEEKTSDEDFSDTETICSGPEYYFSSSYSEDDNPVSSISGLGNLLINLRTHSSEPVNSPPILEPANELHLNSNENAKVPSNRYLKTIFPYNDSETSISSDSIDLHESPISDNKSNCRESHKLNSPKKESSKLDALTVKKEIDLFDLDLDEFIVQDLSEDSCDNSELTSSNEKKLDNSPMNKGIEYPDLVCVKIKTEIIELSDEDWDELKKDPEVSNSNTLSRNNIKMIKNEYDTSCISTSIKTESCILPENLSSGNNFVVSEDVLNQSLPNQFPMTEKRKMENFDNWEESETFIKNCDIKENKKVKLELDTSP